MEIVRHPHVVGSSGIFADETLLPQGAGHLAVIVPLRVRFSGDVFVTGVLVGRTVPPLAILALLRFRFRQAGSTTGDRRRRGNLLAVGHHSPRDQIPSQDKSRSSWPRHCSRMHATHVLVTTRHFPSLKFLS